MKVKPQEIIEFPCILFNLKTLEQETIFHTYVKPVFKPTLSPFCTKLTKITQDKVENAPEFKQVWWCLLLICFQLGRKLLDKTFFLGL